MKSCNDSSSDYGAIEDSFKKMVTAQVSLGKEVLKLLEDAAGQVVKGLGGISLPKGKGCCDIPEPCWMPKSLGDAACTLAAGGEGQIRLVVTNQDYREKPFTVEVVGPDAGLVTLSSSSFKLGPKERTTVTVKVKIPEQGAKSSYDFLIWVRGCQGHYLRWTVTVAAKSKDCCFIVEVNDQPDYVVHWYDHFYCQKPCQNSLTRSPADGSHTHGPN